MATEGYLRIVAGAGSGKTKALTHRYAYLVKVGGIQPQNILCVTFTNKAAGEMRHRVRLLIGEGYDTSLITTYHGFCARVLRDDIEKLFYPKSFLILDNNDQKKILEEIYEELELKLDHSSFQKILTQINIKKEDISYVRNLADPEYKNEFDSKNIDDVIFNMYIQRQKKVFGLDFNDLINFTFYLFEQHQDVLQKWQGQLHYIQVDEFQDSSNKEMRLLDILSCVNENLFVVGDPDQTIYEWRGAQIEILVDFDKRHNPTQTIIMSQNYRSTPQILAVANSLIDKNTIRIKKNLFTKNSDGLSVLHFHAKDEKAEAAWVVSEIKKAIKNETRKYSNFAILYRANFLSRYIEQALLEAGIPYHISGGVRFYDRMEVRDAIAYLRMTAYQDDISLLRIINVPRRKMGKTRLAYLRACAEEEDISLYQALIKRRDSEKFAGTGAEEFISLIEQFRDMNINPSNLMQQILEQSGYENYIRKNGDMERLDNLAELCKVLTEYERSYGEDLTLHDFLNHVALRNDEEKYEENRDSVQLMTIHASKGLEFPCVFIVGMTDGIFPSSRTIEERKLMGLEEERRLCFVAMTRAMEQLYLTESEGYGNGGIRKIPSRFLFDIDENLYERIGFIPEDIIKELRTKKSKTDITAKSFAHFAGDTVNHIIFGNGTIQSIDMKKSVYNILFEKTKKVKPISMDYDFSVKIDTPLNNDDYSDNDIEDDNGNDDYDDNIFDDESIMYDKMRYGELEEESEISPAINTSDSNEKNLWKRSEIPHSGWTCIDLIDLGRQTGICQMCGYQIIRYVHVMIHPNYGGRIGAGCVCAGKMEGSHENAVQRERNFKNLLNRRKNFVNRKWKHSKKGNLYLNFMEVNIVLLPDNYQKGHWRYLINGKPSITYSSQTQAKLGAFDAAVKIINKKSGK